MWYTCYQQVTEGSNVNQLQHNYIEINGINMHYVTAGQGPLVLFLHGFPEFWYSWRHQLAALADQFTVVAPDQRGYHQTDKPSWGYEIDVLVADVVALIEALGHHQALLVGHDWGGAVAWATAMNYPHRVRRLAILNTPHPVAFAKELRTNRQQQQRSLYMGLFSLPFLPELLLKAGDYALIELALTSATRPDAFSEDDLDAYKDAMSVPGALTAALNWYRAAARGGMQGLTGGKVRRCEVPTCLIWGEDDPYLGVELVEATRPYVADLMVHRLPGAGHWVQQEAPEEVNRLLGQFFT
ncbi:MAG: alpha/beta hydrolase [Chloroflexia bacterium]|nr:alpha/beta hydrolase [Chloroflexia bacterium]